MSLRRLLPILQVLAILAIATMPAQAYVAYHSHETFLQVVTKDIVKLLPRAMSSYIFENRYDFMRGMTFINRDVLINPGKMRDLEEIRKDAFHRLSRDIPYCVQAFKEGEIKLDTSHNNLAGRLGMVAYSIILADMPDLPDLEYLERFSRSLDSLVGAHGMDVWVYYDGYGDFHSLGELLERFRPGPMPQFRHARNELFPIRMRHDTFASLRAPEKFDIHMTFNDMDVNTIYTKMINDILDAFTYIWKCSGMDLAHPSYAAPPGTVIQRRTLRRTVAGMAGPRTLTRPPAPRPAAEKAPAAAGAEKPGEAAPPEQTPGE
ncbi:MAG: hypothetical protein AB1664_20395 [Thermodesulfobacteriota bacterium]